MSEVFWLQRKEQDVPEAADWLGAKERQLLDAMRFPKRRAAWRLGRWTAKCAVSAYLGISNRPQFFPNIEVLPAVSGAPEVFLENKPAPATVSFSHRDGLALCAVTVAGVALGCDLEIVEPRDGAFIDDYFTLEEQALLREASGAEQWRLLALLWSAKESALKALHEGLRLDTRSVVVSLEDAANLTHKGPSLELSDWSPLKVSYNKGRVFQGWWQHAGNRVMTLVAAPRPARPILLQNAVTPRSSSTL